MKNKDGECGLGDCESVCGVKLNSLETGDKVNLGNTIGNQQTCPFPFFGSSCALFNAMAGTCLAFFSFISSCS